MARQHFLQNLCVAIPRLDKLVLGRLENAALDSGKPPTDANANLPRWREAYVQHRRAWAQSLLAIWREAFSGSVSKALQVQESISKVDELGLIDDQVIENLIASSRLSMQITDKVAADFGELRKRLRGLEKRNLSDKDAVRPTILTDDLLNCWVNAKMSKDAFVWAMEGILDQWATLLSQAYQAANRFLEEHGAKPEEMSVALPRQQGGQGYPGGAYPAGGAVAGGTAVAHPPHAAGVATGAGPHSAGYALPAGAEYPGGGHGAPQLAHGAGTTSQAAALPVLMPPASFGHQAIAQVNALWSDIRKRLSYVIGTAGAGMPSGGQGQATVATPVATNLQSVMAQQQASVIQHLDGFAGQDATVHAPVAGQQIAAVARKQTEIIKEKASQPNEKAIIEMVALMFQSVLTEDRVPPSVRVLFARLQVPVLRIALSEPEFFDDMSHPVRRLIDRMGSSVMGFDGATFRGSTLENELRRIVQMIEQYPDTGSKVFQLALNEFERFLQKHLAENRISSKAMSVAQQVEEKETLLVKFTIELRKMLQEIPIKDEVRSFLFKVWADVLAVSAVRTGVKSEETLVFKRTATLLVWATSAKSSRRERGQVVQALPKLLLRLRKGLELVGIVDEAQEAAIAQMVYLINEAFLSQNQGIPASGLKALARRLENLENFITHEGVQDIDLNPENIELMLGLDASGLVVVTADTEADVSPEVLAWAKSREPGSWFTLNTHINTRGAALDNIQTVAVQVQYVWQSRQKHLHLFASNEGATYLLKLRTLAAFFQSGQLVPLDQEGLMLRATRVALTQYQSPATIVATQAAPLLEKATSTSTQ